MGPNLACSPGIAVPSSAELGSPVVVLSPLSALGSMNRPSVLWPTRSVGCLLRTCMPQQQVFYDTLDKKELEMVVPVLRGAWMVPSTKETNRAATPLYEAA